MERVTNVSDHLEGFLDVVRCPCQLPAACVDKASTLVATSCVVANCKFATGSQMDRSQEPPHAAAARGAVEVSLRRFDLADVDAMMVWASDPQVAAVCRWEPYESTEPLLAYLRDTVLPHPWFRAICVAAATFNGLEPLYS
uniref:N-acetyltransferase domain-containing protein n=1 Tax=Oryza glumipatula TaxID=40148 RepID=A0A0D9ZEB5_9ORYZ